MLNHVRYLIFVNGYCHKIIYKKKKDAVKMFKILRHISEKGTQLKLLKGWYYQEIDEPLVMTLRESIVR